MCELRRRGLAQAAAQRRCVYLRPHAFIDALYAHAHPVAHRARFAGHVYGHSASYRLERPRCIALGGQGLQPDAAVTAAAGRGGKGILREWVVIGVEDRRRWQD